MWEAPTTADELLAAAVRTESTLQKEAATAARTTTTALRKIKREQLADPKNGYAGMMHHLRAPRGDAMAVVAKADGSLTSNVRGIHQMFTDTWMGIYTRLNNAPAKFSAFA